MVQVLKYLMLLRPLFALLATVGAPVGNYSVCEDFKQPAGSTTTIRAVLSLTCHTFRAVVTFVEDYFFLHCF